jgi:hypothetical protein
MTRVTLPASGRQQRHLAFIAEHTCNVRHTPGVDNVVADALSRPPAPPPPANPSVQVCHVAVVVDLELSPLDLKEIALQQIFCQQAQQLLHDPGLRIGFKQVGDLKLWGDVSTSRFRPLVPLPDRRQLFDHLHRPAHPRLRATHRIISTRYVWRGLARDIMAKRMFELPKRKSAPSRVALACSRNGAGAAVLTYPCGSCGAAARLGGCHLRVHSHRREQNLVLLF